MKGKITLVRVIRTSSAIEYKVIGYLFRQPEVGKELKYVSHNNLKEYGAQEIVESIEEESPSRIRIYTDRNEFIGDKLNM